ncbi:MAG: hypothetical protein K2O12_05395, partial [Muribaculaceae bacterium]|nr:hypothetical protein [Muribaculaceae bacterium]
MRQYLLLLLLPSYYMAQGQNTDTDTIPVRELGEITVTAETQRAEATKTIYLPTGRQKDSASDGITLLARMNIPQLSVNPVSETIKTIDGQGISMFINFHPATAEDVAGLNPSVVKRVEYMNSPIDPRFLRAQHVVNIITHEYAYGGYTKLNGKERWLIHSGNASVYSKFVYGQMEYDVMLSCDYDYNPHTGTTNDESYKFATGSIVRESGTETGRYHERGLFAGLRTSWNKKQNISFRNLVTYRKNHIPVNETSGYLRFSQLYPSESFSSESLVKSSSLGWGSELYASMNKGWSISGNFNAEILNSKTADNYKTEVSSIINHANEDSWLFRGNVQANKSLSDRISLFVNTLSGVGHTNIKYTGTSNAENRFRQTFMGIYLGVALNYKKMSGSIDGGYAFESNHINDKRTYDRYPFT